MSSTVGDLLRIKGTAVEVIAPSGTILEAIRHMSKTRIGCLAVVTKAGKLSGIITERDCLWKVIASGESIRKSLVKDKMTKIAQMETVTPSQTVEDCMGLITTGRHRHLPVVKAGKLVGLVSIGDVVKFMLDSQQATIQSLEKYITGTF